MQKIYLLLFFFSYHKIHQQLARKCVCVCEYIFKHARSIPINATIFIISFKNLTKEVNSF